MTSRTTLGVAAFLGALAVGLGAFGAHALKPMLIASGRLETYQTAVTYHFYHVFALLATGIAMQLNPGRKLSYASDCFSFGIILFSGSLYGMCFTDLTMLAMITPVGGVLFIAGWVLMMLAFLKK